MKYLYLQPEDGRAYQSDEDPSEEDLERVDEGILDVFRSTIRGFERASVNAVDDSRSAVWTPVDQS